MNDLKILRPAELAEMLGISKATLWRYTRRDDFPTKINLGDRAVGFRLADVEDYLNKQSGSTDEEVSNE